MDTQNKVAEILEELCPDEDVRTSKALVEDRILTSMTMIALVAELEDEFDIAIPAVEVVVENFNSVEAIAALVDRLREEDLD